MRRVTALDPAYPCFENESASLRLHKSDAKFVDVYHTNSEPGKNKGNLGIHDIIGNEKKLNFCKNSNFFKFYIFGNYDNF